MHTGTNKTQGHVKGELQAAAFTYSSCNINNSNVYLFSFEDILARRSLGFLNACNWIRIVHEFYSSSSICRGCSSHYQLNQLKQGYSNCAGVQCTDKTKSQKGHASTLWVQSLKSVTAGHTSKELYWDTRGKVFGQQNSSSGGL